MVNEKIQAEKRAKHVAKFAKRKHPPAPIVTAVKLPDHVYGIELGTWERRGWRKRRYELLVHDVKNCPRCEMEKK